ncbi:molybdopterin-dependent oxidoreductase [Halorientalis salina]|uniref:molybdopterin-dependent oxidoreductase n=1 Tax=Halorientalis salina TaxID=2932266 RepID=UPI0010AD4735|nr:molybdopterin-dependent oxidoreductase [Halorientalis salina]
MHGDHSETMTATERDDRETVDPDVADRDGVLVDGETPVSLPATVEAASEQFEATTRTIGFECASGDWLEAEWTGVPLDPVLEAASIPPETTHVLVAATDGYRACVAVWDLGGAMLAYDAVDRPTSDFPRFVSPSVDGPRAVKNLASVRPVELDPHEDPQDYEELYLDET